MTIVTSGALAAASISAASGGASVGLGAGIGAAFGGTVASGAAAGWGLSAIGLAAVGATGAAVGSIASQAVGVATGIQERFSWKGVALSAIAGGVGGGLSGIGVFDKVGIAGTNPLAAGARGVVSNVANQGIGLATGLQSKFDFAGVAAAGVGAAAGYAVGDALKVKSFQETRSFSNVANTALTGSARAIANAATRSAIEGTSFGDNVMRALPDAIGQTIGELIAAEAQGPSERRKLENLIKDLVKGARRGSAGLGSVEGFEALDGGTRLGPRDNVDTSNSSWIPDSIEDFIWSAEARAREVLDLIDKGKYSEVIEKYFAVKTKLSGGSNEFQIALDKLQISDAERVGQGLLNLIKLDSGKRLFIAHAFFRNEVQIITVDRSKDSGFDRNTRIVNIDFAEIERLAYIPQNTERWKIDVVGIGHELGHSALGYGDPKAPTRFAWNEMSRNEQLANIPRPEQGPNVRYVENAIRAELGLPDRQYYVTEELVEWYKRNLKPE